MSNGWRGGSTRAGRRVRAHVLARDNYLCRIRVPGSWTIRTGETRACLTAADCVHHTQGKAATGDDPDYMIAACTPCNLKVGDPTKTPDPAPRPTTRW